jgi:YgiT-type zinc finger domain-containing protein
MKKDVSEERFVEQKVTYTLEIDGRFVIVENVPARVSERTGERFFSPETVESLQRIVWGTSTPTRVIQTPVFEFPGVR